MGLKETILLEYLKSLKKENIPPQIIAAIESLWNDSTSFSKEKIIAIIDDYYGRN